jgi:hypothetical protein
MENKKGRSNEEYARKRKILPHHPSFVPYFITSGCMLCEMPSITLGQINEMGQVRGKGENGESKVSACTGTKQVSLKREITKCI